MKIPDKKESGKPQQSDGLALRRHGWVIRAVSAGRLWAVWSVMLVVGAALLRFQFLEGLGTNAPHITFYPAVVIAALYGGLRAGFLTLSLSAAVGIYFWVEPVHTFTIRNPVDWLLLVTFLITTALISFVTEAMHRARARAHAALEREVAAQAQREADERLRFALEQSQTGGWHLDLADHTVLRTLKHDQIFGYESLLPEWTYERFLEHVLPEDRAEVDQRFRTAIAAQSDWSFECRIRRKDGAVRWIWATGGHQRDTTGLARRMAGIVQDITERKQAEALVNGQEQVLEMIARGIELPATLTALVRFTETQAPGMLGSILLLDGDGVHVRHGAAPSLPAEFVAAIDGEPIGPCAGSCGTAAFRKEAVFVADIATDPLWAAYKAVALPHGLRACWSTPIFDESHGVLGTFAMYYRQPALPEPEHRQLIDLATHTAAIAISRHRAAAALRAKSEELDRYFTNSLDLLCIADTDGFFRRLNPEWERTLGYPLAELEGRRFLDFIHPEDMEATLAALHKLSSREHVLNFVNRYRHRDGSYRWIEWRSYAEESRVFAVARDITERTQAEARIRSVFQQANDGIYVISADNCYLEANPRGFELLGYTRDELLKMSVADVLASHEAARLAIEPPRMMSGVPHFAEWEHVRKDGSRFPGEVSARRLDDRSYLAIVRDLTERRQAEAALRASEEQFRETFYRAGVGKVQVEPGTGRFLRVNPAFCEFIGYPEAELIGKTFPEITFPDDHKADAALYARLLRREIPTYTREKRYVRKDGRVVWGSVSVTLLFNADGHASLATAVVQDITARQQAEQERQKFVLLAESSSEFIGMCDREFKPFYVNAAGMRLVGLPDIEAACRVKVQDFFFPEDQPFITEEFFPRVLRERQGEAEIRFRHFQTGEAIWMLYSVFNIRDASGTPVGWATVSRDITERRQAEAALRESETRLRLVLDGLGSQMFVGLLDTEGVVLVANRPALEAAGLRVEEVLGQPVHETYWFTYSEAVAQRFRAAVQRATQGETVRYDEQIRVAEGRLIWVAFTVNPLRDESGEVVFLVPSAVVIDERKQAEVARRESEARLRLSAEAANVGLWDWDLKTNRVYFSREWKSQIGYREDEITNEFSEWQSRVHPDDLETTQLKVQAYLANPQGRHETEFRFRHKDGSYRWIYTHADVLRDTDGRPTRMLGCHIDITARKQAEAALRESEERLRLALDAAQMGTFDWDMPGHRIVWSRWHEELWGFQPGEFGGTYEAFSERVHPDDLPGINAEVARCIAAREPFRHEFRVVWPDASIHWILATGEFAFDAAGQPQRMRGAVMETTTRRQAEEEVRRSREQLRALSARLESLQEEERTRISREIHDELGQMLTGIKMDLRWIEHRLDDFSEDRRLNPILDKLIATAELTDATVKTVQRVAAELRPGILDKLGLGMALQYETSQFEQRTGITCRLVLPDEDRPLSPQAATTFFRIFQEALTNVARHAHATAVEVELHPEADVCRLEIRDNGRGLTGVNLASPTSLGLLGMQERARLLGGEVAFTARPGGGTIVVVRIPNPATSQTGV